MCATVASFLGLPVQCTVINVYNNVKFTLCSIHDIMYSIEQYNTVQYSTVQYSTVQYSTVQYSTVQ